MTTILLEKNKKDLRKSYVNEFLTKLFFSLSFIIIIWLILEGAVWGSILLEENSLSRQAKQEQKTEREKILDEYKKEITELKNLNKKFSIQKKSGSEIINYLYTQKPKDINFSSIQITKEDNHSKINISGLASNRESLLTFTKLLEQNKYVEDFNFPISNLTKNFDIPFNITFIIDKDE